jgi:hypothetical protein
VTGDLAAAKTEAEANPLACSSLWLAAAACLHLVFLEDFKS